VKTTLAERLESQLDKSGGADACWPWTGSTSKGYGRFNFEKSFRLAHRVAFALASGEAPPGLGVLHRCDNKRCCNPKHLFLGTQADNMLDMVLKDRQRVGPVHHGKRNPMARLTTENIADIRGAYEDGEATTEQIASEYGITHQHAVRIVQAKAWKNTN
jgi:hypothetical protein